MANQSFQATSYLENPIEEDNSEGIDNRIRHRVEVQSMQIERVLSQHHVPVDIEGGTFTGERVNFNLRSHMSGGIDRVRMIKDELISALGVSDVKLQRDNGAVKLVVRRNVPHPVDLLDMLEQERAADNRLYGIEAALGLDEEGRSVMLNLAFPDVNNVLVAGKDGAGKSSLLRTMAVSLAIKYRQGDVQIGIISAGSVSNRLVATPDALYPMNYLPHLLFPVVVGVEESVEALEFLADEVRYRQESKLESPLLILIIDDVDILLNQGGAAFGDPLLRVLDSPIDAGLRSILAATDPMGSGLAPMLKHNLPLRLIGRVRDEQEAYALTAQPESGANYLNGQGDFLAVSYNNTLRFQSAFIDDYDLHLTLTGLHRKRKGTLLARSLNDKRYDAKSNGASGEVSFEFDDRSGQAKFTQQSDQYDNTSGDIIDGSVTDFSEDNDWLTDRQSDDDQNLPSIKLGEASTLPIGEEEVENAMPITEAGLRIVAYSGSNGVEKESSEEMANDENESQSIQKELEYSDLDEDEWLPDSQKEQTRREANRPH